MHAKRISFATATLLALFSLVGCQNSSAPMGSTMASPQKAIVISGANAGSYVVVIPSSDPNNPVMLSTAGAEMCSQCKEDAIKYFQTGQIETKCPKCGATRTPVVINTNVGHQ